MIIAEYTIQKDSQNQSVRKVNVTCIQINLIYFTRTRMKMCLEWLFFSLVHYLAVLRALADDTNHTTEQPTESTSRADQIEEDYMEDVGRKNREWEISRGPSLVTYGDTEDCMDSNKMESMCGICWHAMNQTSSPRETERLRHAGFLQGVLIFPNTKYEDRRIDVVMCAYYPTMGIARFYLTQGKRKNSVYFINLAGKSPSDTKFTLHGNYVTW